MKIALYVSWLLYLLAEVLGYSLISTWWPLKNEANLHTERKFLMWPHATGMVIVTVLIGRGMLLFRIASGLPTRLIKWIHGLYFIVVTILIALLTHYIRIGAEEIKYPDGSEDNLIPTKGQWNLSHNRLSYIVLAFYTAEIVMSFLVYLYMYADQKIRRLYMAVHNFSCLIIFELLVINILSFLAEFITYPTPIIGESLRICNISSLLMCFAAIVTAVVINPHLEFEIVGPI